MSKRRFQNPHANGKNHAHLSDEAARRLVEVAAGTPPADAPAGGPPATPGLLPSDPQTAAAIQRIQAVLQGQGVNDPTFLLGQAYVENARLRESLNVAVQEMTRLSTKLAEIEGAKEPVKEVAKKK